MEALRLGRGRCFLEVGQGAACVAAGQVGQGLGGLRVDRDAIVESARVAERPFDEPDDFGVRERPQSQQQGPGQQRRVHGEARVLGGRGDEGHGAVFDGWQQDVLLRFREAVHLVDEQHRACAVGLASLLSCCESRADFLYAGGGGGEFVERLLR